MMKLANKIVLLLFTCLATNTLQAEEASQVSVEPQLIRAIHKVQQKQLDGALDDVEKLVEREPRFHLAKLVYADLMMAKAGMPVQLGMTMAGQEQERLQDLLSEARVRWNRYQKPVASDRLPGALLHLSEQQQVVLVADLSRSRLYLYENDNGQPRLITDFYVSSGKNGEDKQIEGDKKTPLGVYFVTSELDGEKLPDLYGTGAFPVDYPNAWDKRQGKTGHGIWLHGVPSNTYSRAPRSSDGCLAVSNRDLDSLKPFIDIGVTPVVIGKQMDWLTRGELEQQRKELMAAIEQWRQDWQSLNTEKYLSHYAKDFQSDGKNYETWKAHKRRVNQYKSYIKVELSNLSLIAHPDQPDMVVVSYRQNYRSDNLNGSRNKRQYWRKQSDGRWKIVYEGKG